MTCHLRTSKRDQHICITLSTKLVGSIDCLHQRVIRAAIHSQANRPRELTPAAFNSLLVFRKEYQRLDLKIDRLGFLRIRSGAQKARRSLSEYVELCCWHFLNDLGHPLRINSSGD